MKKKQQKKKKVDPIFTVPKKIHLLGEEYEIVFVPSKLIDQYSKLGSKSQIDGQIKYNKKKIYIDKIWERSKRESILWHELGHYFGDYYNITRSEAFAEGFAKFVLSCIKQLGYKK